MAKKLHSNIKFDITSLDLYDSQAIDCTDETDMMLKLHKLKGFRWGSYNKCLLLFPFWGETKAYFCVTPCETDTTAVFGSNCWIKSIDLTNLT